MLDYFFYYALSFEYIVLAPLILVPAVLIALQYYVLEEKWEALLFLTRRVFSCYLGTAGLAWVCAFFVI